MAKVKETVETEDEDGNALKLDVLYPSGNVWQESQHLYNAKWQELVDKDIKVKKQIHTLMEEKGIWGAKDELKKITIINNIVEMGKRLKHAKGEDGKTLTKKQGKDLALQILQARNQLRELLQEYNELEGKSAESMAENFRFDYLVSVCTVYNTDGKPYFKSLEDYENRRTEKASWDAASKLAGMVYGGTDFSDDYEEGLIEIQFLKQHKFIDKDRNFINEKGEITDSLGNILTGDTDKVDAFGNKLDKKGKPIFEFDKFADEPETEVSETIEFPAENL